MCKGIGHRLWAQYARDASIPALPSQRTRGHTTAVPVQDSVYWSLIEHLIQEHNERLLTHHDRFLGQYLIPTQLGALKVDGVDKIYIQRLQERPQC